MRRTSNHTVSPSWIVGVNLKSKGANGEQSYRTKLAILQLTSSLARLDQQCKLGQTKLIFTDVVDPFPWIFRP
ncbi:Trefoil factor [Trichinella spiralis]|uniref:Trefoil factor n=1 Tax=Trichinella spiralis TaxID=6334 RepID=A0ABR3KAW9_TRISP